MRFVERPCQDLAIDHAAVGKIACRLFDLRETPIQAFFAARPEHGFSLPAHQLGTNAVPFPLGQPLADIAKRCDLLFQRRGEEKRVGTLSRMLVGALGSGQCPEGRGAGCPVATETVCDQVRGQVRPLRERLHHEPVRHAHP